MNPEHFTSEEEAYLLKIAEHAIKTYLEYNTAPEIRYNPFESLRQKRGVFINLMQNNKFVGFSGSISQDATIIESVVKHAVAAAFGDKSCEQIVATNGLDIEIFVANEPEETDIEQIKKGECIAVQRGNKHAVFLSHAWERFPDKEHFLSHLCLKAGLHPESWMDKNTTLYRFDVYRIKK